MASVSFSGVGFCCCCCCYCSFVVLFSLLLSRLFIPRSATLHPVFLVSVFVRPLPLIIVVVLFLPSFPSLPPSHHPSPSLFSLMCSSFHYSNLPHIPASPCPRFLLFSVYSYYHIHLLCAVRTFTYPALPPVRPSHTSHLCCSSFFYPALPPVRPSPTSPLVLHPPLSLLFVLRLLSLSLRLLFVLHLLPVSALFVLRLPNTHTHTLSLSLSLLFFLHISLSLPLSLVYPNLSLCVCLCLSCSSFTYLSLSCLSFTYKTFSLMFVLHLPNSSP